MFKKYLKLFCLYILFKLHARRNFIKREPKSFCIIPN